MLITSKVAKKVGDIVFAQFNFTFKAAASPNNVYEVADMGGIGTLATRGLGSYLNGSAWVSGGGIATVNPTITVKAESEQYAQFVFMTT